LLQVEALDRILARLTQVASGAAMIGSETFAPLLFARWARHLLHLEPSFAPLSRAQATAFFRLLRRGETGPPYRMERYRNVFIEEFRKGAAGFESAAPPRLVARFPMSGMCLPANTKTSRRRTYPPATRNICRSGPAGRKRISLPDKAQDGYASREGNVRDRQGCFFIDAVFPASCPPRAPA